jgi:Kef-type K+ transport system membrane component KefB
MCEDLIAILMLAVLITVSRSGGVSLYAFTIKASLLSLFIVVVMGVGLITVPYVLRVVAQFNRPETLLIVSMGLCFGLAMIAERAGYSLVLGAFLAGSLVAESAQSLEIERLIVPVRHIFGALFFVSVGMLIDSQLLLKRWRELVLFSVVVITGKIVSVSLASLLIGQRLCRAQGRSGNGADRQRVCYPSCEGGEWWSRADQLPLRPSRGDLFHYRIPLPIADAGNLSDGGFNRARSCQTGRGCAFSRRYQLE